MFIEILIQNIIVLSSIVMILRCFSNYAALPQNMYDDKSLETAEKLFKDDENYNELWAKRSFFSFKKNIFEFIILLVLLIVTYKVCELKNIIATLIFSFISLATVYPFLPKDMPADGGYAGYSIKSWVLFIIALILSVTISTLFLFYFF